MKIINEDLTQKLWYEFTLKKMIKMESDYAYSFHFNYYWRKRDEPTIVAIVKVYFSDNGIVYSKQFPNQWQQYILDETINTKDVIYYDRTGDTDFYHYVIINGKPYRETTVTRQYIEDLIRGYKQISLFDL